MDRYEIIESKHWVRNDGAVASIYGAVPWTSASERDRWRIEVVGWTVFDKVTNTVGLGRRPFKTREEVEVFLDKFKRNKK